MRFIWGLFLISFSLLALDLSQIDPSILKDINEVVEASKNMTNPQRSLSASEDLTKSEQCKGCPSLPQGYDSGLMVLVSATLPDLSWEEHSHYLEKCGGKFVMRGFPKNSFRRFIQFVKAKKDQGVFASIELDPDLFEKYHAQAVPAIILDDGKSFDKIEGNISVLTALELFAKSGSTAKLAKELLFQIKQSKTSEVLYESH